MEFNPCAELNFLSYKVSVSDLVSIPSAVGFIMNLEVTSDHSDTTGITYYKGYLSCVL